MAMRGRRNFAAILVILLQWTHSFARVDTGVELGRFRHPQKRHIPDYANEPSECKHQCNNKVRPVCDADGKLYLNECTMKHQACLKGITITMVKWEECSFNVCQKENRVCNEVYEPLCGSDGQWYNNSCEMMKTSCGLKEGAVISIRHGACPSNETGFAPPNNDTPPENITRTWCSSDIRPVCDSEGKLYYNDCTMKRAEKELGTPITKIAWEDCSFTWCKKTMYCYRAVKSSMCGSDGKMYGNKCWLLMASCGRQDGPIKSTDPIACKP